MNLPKLVILIAFLSTNTNKAFGEVIIHFSRTTYQTEEGNQINLQISKTGNNTEELVALVLLSEAGYDDFIGKDQLGIFEPNGPAEIDVMFTVKDDEIPEIAETYTFTLSVKKGSAIVGEPKTAEVTIKANDDAYGIFSFAPPYYLETKEENVTTVLDIPVLREKGTFGDVELTYKVTGKTKDALPGEDLSPVSGTILFFEGQTEKKIQLQKRNDELPENDEIFVVELKGMSLSGRLDKSSVDVVILANDAPVQFAQEFYRVEEGPGLQTIYLEVLRGMRQEGGPIIGNVNITVDVNYRFKKGTTTINEDFISSDGRLTFWSGETKKQISVQIIDDTIPELDETFTIELYGVDNDAILGTVSSMSVTIIGNDNPFGVIAFKSNDPTQLTRTIDEDTFTYIVFPVIRSGGAFSEVSIRWLISRMDLSTDPVTTDVGPGSGLLVFKQNQKDAFINLTIVQENDPETAEKFSVQLLPQTIIGGAVAKDVIDATLIIEDSDNIYGIIEFDSDELQKVINVANQRSLRLTFKRIGGTLGIVKINISLDYFDNIGSYDVFENSEMIAYFSAGNSKSIVDAHLAKNAFIRIDGVFTATINSVALETEPTNGVYNSPKVGNKQTVTVIVTSIEASGEIGFHNITEPVVVQEPVDGQMLRVPLQLSREGVGGRAQVYWSMTLTGTATVSDIAPLSGTVVMELGHSLTSLELQVYPDKIPEVNEEVFITLTSVEPNGMQKLRASDTKIKLIIEQNDNPGGVFQFADFVLPKYVLEEEGTPIELTVERFGGALMMVPIQYAFNPDGTNDFYGATNVLKFEAGVRTMNFTILARGDGVPELSETFVLKLQSYGEIKAAFGAKTEILVEVTKNDKPHGVIQFEKENQQYIIGESKGNDIKRAYITVLRKSGTFGNVKVDYDISPVSDNDYTPVAGNVVFTDGSSEVTIAIASVADELHEPDEYYELRLYNPTGGAQLGEFKTVTIIIEENDYPLYFSNVYNQVREPGFVTLTVKRDGDFDKVNTMKYKTIDGSATSLERDFQSILGSPLKFEIGEKEKQITINIFDDDIAEGNETFGIQLFDVDGDLSLLYNANATITILANDDSYGIFSFENTESKACEEGSTTSLDILRSTGSHGAVNVLWAIYDPLTNKKLDINEFVTTSGKVLFNPKEVRRTLSITPLNDEIPEKDKIYILRLTGVEVVDGRTDEILAKLATSNIEVRLIILANEDPHGRFAFKADSIEKSIAEDFHLGGDSTTQTSLEIERRQGAFGTSQVVWEAFSDKIGGNLPELKDLLFLGTIPTGVKADLTKQRNGTGTMVVILNGLEDNFIEVEKEYHPTEKDIKDGFTISAWIQPLGSLDGYIVAKTAAEDQRKHYYALKIVSTTTQKTELIFSYSTNNNTSPWSVSGSSILDIQDGNWHHVLVTVSISEVGFFIDGRLISRRAIIKNGMLDGVGDLYVGALPPGTNRFVGYLQDVRIFSRVLEENEIEEIFLTPSHEDIYPISGYIEYKEGEKLKSIALKSLQDIEEERNEVFSIKLISVKGGATLSKTDSSSTLTVLKSDNSNGLFGFLEPCTPQNVEPENSVITCTVSRTRGDDGTVKAVWAIMYGSTFEKDDFVNFTGDLVFGPGERRKTFQIMVKDDNIPELDEYFMIKLISVSSDDGLVGTTNTSGASISLSSGTSPVTIKLNDYPYGLLQFSESTTPPLQNRSMILPITSRPEVHVQEDAGFAKLMIVRAQGVLGHVSAEWRTSDLTAKSEGQQPDFEPGAGRVEMADGQNHVYISVKLIDNSIPEGDKTFTVQLSNPTGGSAVDIGSTVTVVIDPSDSAFGVFQFSEDSLAVAFDEIGDTGVTTFKMKVVRLRGSIGLDTVFWRIEGDTENDFAVTAGNIKFGIGQTAGILNIQIRGDFIPELDEHFVVKLVRAEKGELGHINKISASVTILANDFPYGQFVISETERPVIVTERYRNVTITVQRLGGTYGLVHAAYQTMQPDETSPYLPIGVARANYSDFSPTSGVLPFRPGVRSATFEVLILDDNFPEDDESVFLKLGKLTLVESVAGIQKNLLPELGDSATPFGQIIISSNDNAHGVIEFESISVAVHENNTGPVISLVRSGGSIGEVSVKFRVFDEKAVNKLDFVVLSDTVVMVDGETKKGLPIEIIDDRVPEFREDFLVELLEVVSGGAILGNLKKAFVSIVASDDPNGAFGFATKYQTVLEPEFGLSGEVEITVLRTGGTSDVVTLVWEAKLNGMEATADVTPTTGLVYFLSDETRRTIKLRIKPDDIPEGKENIEMRLVTASNGGRITENNLFILTIAANDNPHGSVKFSQRNYTVVENLQDSVQYIGILREGGDYGKLKLDYMTVQLSPTEAAKLSGKSLLHYYGAPFPSKRNDVGINVFVSNSNNLAENCAEACLKTDGCKAFQISTGSGTSECTWFSIHNPSIYVPTTTHKIYVKSTEKVRELIESVATEGQDYQKVAFASVFIDDQASATRIPINILGDTVPEISERFILQLTRVSLVDPSILSGNSPYIEKPESAIITIALNDNAYGVFRMYCNSPFAEVSGKNVSVEERNQFALNIVVEREGGSIGDVAVDWFVNKTTTTAVYGVDYIADGATLMFSDGLTRRVFTVTILDDAVPENNKTFTLQLRNPQKGSIIGTESSLNVIILENDNVAGVLGFDTTSILGSEGDTISIKVKRTKSSEGIVTVNWKIQGLNGLHPARGFEQYQGSLTFQKGETSKIIQLQVLTDSTPEVNEEYQIQLSDIQTEGVGLSGEAVIDKTFGTASITIEGSNNPHGVIQFAINSQKIYTEENTGKLALQIDRKFGAIGSVRVSYVVKRGTLSSVSNLLMEAIPGSDFTPATDYIDLKDGIPSGTIYVDILDDNIPEVEEAFLVSMTSVNLIDETDNSLPPKLASNFTTAEVIINANDGTKGVLVFSPDSTNVTVDEITKNITLSVHRDRGTFGEVSVFFYAQSLTQGAVPGTDYKIQPKELVFGFGVDAAYIKMEIINDDVPEPDEQIEVILSSPKNGVELGKPSKAIVTIKRNDDASGYINFDASSDVEAEEADGRDSVNSEISLKLVRGPGIYGTVNVQYEILTNDGQLSTDLSPARGFATFQNLQAQTTLDLTVVDDDIPEILEVFTIKLQQPDNGGKLGSIISRIIRVARSDSPFGLVQIYPRKQSSNSVIVEENVGRLLFDIVREKGTLGQVSVDLLTEPETASGGIGVNNLILSPLQYLGEKYISDFHSFHHSETNFLIVLSASRVGEMQSDIGSDGSVNTIINYGFTNSAIYKWQGIYTLIQTIDTDGADKATSFNINNVQYVAIANYGGSGRTSKSRLYLVNNDGTLVVIQEFITYAAKDVHFVSSGQEHFLIFVNSLSTSMSTDIYIWKHDTNLFSTKPHQTIPKSGASAVNGFMIGTNTYIAIANYYDDGARSFEIDSVVFKLSQQKQFIVHQKIQTQGAVDVKSLKIGNHSFLVFANNQQNIISTPQTSVIYEWDDVTQEFLRFQDIKTSRVEAMSVTLGPDNREVLIFANKLDKSKIHRWNPQLDRFEQAWSGEAAKIMTPITIQQKDRNMHLVATNFINTTKAPCLGELLDIQQNSDFVPRLTTFTFEPGQTRLNTSIEILQDNNPEDTENLTIVLRNPSSGLEIGSNDKVTIEILSNDNAHGVIEFAQDSMEKREEELVNKDNAIQLSVMRSQGHFGRVVVRWEYSGDHDGIRDISPSEGQLQFADGQSVATITLIIRDDNLAELDEVTYVTLTNIIENGSNLPSKGARIGENKVAKVIVKANDSPYGVITWHRAEMSTDEPIGTDSLVILYALRAQGNKGDLRVSFVTSGIPNLDTSMQATAGEDYISRQGSVSMPENVTRVPVEITIKQDEIPEIAESFTVTLTDVSFMGTPPSPGAKPAIGIPGNVFTVTILENDRARGVVSFDVDTNIEGRIDTYEEFQKNNTIHLKVKRTVGFFWAITATWQAEPREATVMDFYPSSGTVHFGDGVKEKTIDITISDDNLRETMETFDVKLISVTGGAIIGSKKNVRVAILKNDSPFGLFKFSSPQATVKESQTLSDPYGTVSLDIERIQGSEGVVHVQWRLSSEATNEFYEPHFGSLTFIHGEKKKSIQLQTLPDNILEGEERYKVSIIAVDNDADISPTQSDATIIIEPDTGASGVVSVLPDYRNVVIGEPGESDPSYNGKVEIKITRGKGIYGNASVTWSIVPRNSSVFLQLEGKVSFVNLQQDASVIIQSKNDLRPELRSTYSLYLNSATGGAKISTDPGAYIADIIFVASDYPHGLIEFTLPEKMSISEDKTAVTIPIRRRFGTIGQILVSYASSDGTATKNEDYYPTSGTVKFENGQDIKEITINLKPDTLPEGPEKFYVNITSVELIIPRDNDYSIVNGLQLDMKPKVGENNVKTVVILKNDNAEGTIEFEFDTITIRESVGIAKIPVKRAGGTYGTVGVKFSTIEQTAKENLDFVPMVDNLVFEDGVSNNTIDIKILDDIQIEPAETFQVMLQLPSGGAFLGNKQLVTVTIAKSDYPNGKFSFIGDTTITMPNPVNVKKQAITIERTGGLKGMQEVRWRIMGPNSPKLVLQNTSDISYLDVKRGEVTEGSLRWNDGEAGRKSFTLNIKPYSSWEIEKTFYVVMYRIKGIPEEVGDGEVSLQDDGTFIINIEKHGDPSGIIQFARSAWYVREIEEPGQTEARELRFGVTRKIGTGIEENIKVYWRLKDISKDSGDVEPTEGSVLIPDKVRDAFIVIKILPDDIPELNEVFTVELVSVEGGAELDKEHVTAQFRIRYNDNPHGVFAIIPKYQEVIVNPSDLNRYLRLNFTRYQGTFGNVVLSYTATYDKSGISLEKTSSSVEFTQGQTHVTTDIKITGNGFLEMDSTFTVTLINVQYTGNDITDAPALKAGETVAKVSVPANAANSEVGFLTKTLIVDEEYATTRVTLYRRGTYRDVVVTWKSGFPITENFDGYVPGKILPNGNTVTMLDGIEQQNFTVRIENTEDASEQFVIYIPAAPFTQASGGARLLTGERIIKIEPYGLVRFTQNSRDLTVSELQGKVELTVERLFGTENRIDVHYITTAATATSNEDFTLVENGIVTIPAKKKSTTLNIGIKQDRIPETEEMFFVNLTSVEKYPTSLKPGISPRMSQFSTFATIKIKESNDPYGILYIEPHQKLVREEHRNVSLKIKRSGGLYGDISVRIRTVGGGESWTKEIAPIQDSSNNDTIAEILGNRDQSSKADVDFDYEVIDQVLEFKPNEEEKNVYLTILSDSIAEPSETVLVYLTSPRGGARIATGSQDGGSKGFSVITIDRNDLSNGVVGFTQDSKFVTVNEDTTDIIRLKLARLNAYYGDVKVYWRVKASKTSSSEDDSALASQLATTMGVALCPPTPLCTFEIKLLQDEDPEEMFNFLVKLEGVETDAILNTESIYANVTVESSDHVAGVLGFAKSSRFIIVSSVAKKVRLEVERLKGQGYDVSVGYSTMQMTSPITENDIKINPALENEDFKSITNKVAFKANKQGMQYIDIELKNIESPTNSLPKQFYVDLFNPTNGASLNTDHIKAVIRLVDEKDVAIWKAITNFKSGPLDDDSNILETLRRINTIAQDGSEEDEMKMIDNALESIIDEGMKRPLPSDVTSAIRDVFCKLLSPEKNDATRGRFGLAELFEKFAYTMLTGKDCPSPKPPELISEQCLYVKVSAGRWLVSELQGFEYGGQRGDKFTLPSTIPNVKTTDSSQCLDFHITEYNSEQWFKRTVDSELLSTKILSFGIKDRVSGYSESPTKFRIHTPDRRASTRKAECVYFETAVDEWKSDGICEVTNEKEIMEGNLDYVDCSCKHLTHYAVRAKVDTSGLVGYPLWFYISCFICMACLMLAIVTHHMFAINAMFSAGLIMHMIFAAIATQVCYVVAAYLSPTEIIVGTQEDNYRCIVMGIFMQYFFLAQFTWILTQTINYWKILILNDEHTDRKYMLFFLLGWGLPVVFVVVFYITTFLLYKYEFNETEKFDFIYGDVNNNGEMCFITNPYAALGGVIIPTLLMLAIVAGMLIRSFQNVPQWQAYDDVYRGKYNINEIRMLLAFWTVIVFTWLWGGLHLSYGQLWMLILFVIFNILQGILALAFYVVIRLPCCGFQKSSYAVHDSAPHFPTSHYHLNNASSISSLQSSKASILPETWEKESTAPSGHIRVKRAFPSTGNIYVTPPMAYRTSDVASETKEFDFMMSTMKEEHHYTPSENSFEIDNMSDISNKFERFETKRIDISDTHL